MRTTQTGRPRMAARKESELKKARTLRVLGALAALGTLTVVGASGSTAAEKSGATVIKMERDGKTLFFNLFGRARFDEPPVEGMTCAVTGPWHRGPL